MKWYVSIREQGRDTNWEGAVTTDDDGTHLDAARAGAKAAKLLGNGRGIPYRSIASFQHFIGGGACHVQFGKGRGNPVSTSNRYIIHADPI